MTDIGAVARSLRSNGTWWGNLAADDIERLWRRSGVLRQIEIWDREAGHDGKHPGPCAACQRVDLIEKADKGDPQT